MVLRALCSSVSMLAASAFVLVGGSASGALWGPDGHKIVAQIAYDNLTPTAKTEVDKLLDGDTLPGIANWADDVRDQRPATKPWHFADMQPGDDSFDLGADCPSEGCAVKAILDFSAKLSSASAPKPERQEAHVLPGSFRRGHPPAPARRPRLRQGGQRHPRQVLRSSQKLHAVWDSGLIKRKGLSWTAYAQDLESKIKPTEKQTIQAVTDPGLWATESHLLAETHAYVTNTGDISSGDSLGTPYYDENIGVVDEQLTKGGLRLAATLNAIFDPPVSGGSSPGGGRRRPPT
jgi:hypothetical protein